MCGYVHVCMWHCMCRYTSIRIHFTTLSLSGCASLMKRCFECKTKVTEKLGLEKISPCEWSQRLLLDYVEWLNGGIKSYVCLLVSYKLMFLVWSFNSFNISMHARACAYTHTHTQLQNSLQGLKVTQPPSQLLTAENPSLMKTTFVKSAALTRRTQPSCVVISCATTAPSKWTTVPSVGRKSNTE